MSTVLLPDDFLETTGISKIFGSGIATTTLAVTDDVTLPDGSIVGTYIDAGTITSDKLYAGSIDADLIQGNQIAANTITAGNIDADSITAVEIQAGTITSDLLYAGDIQADLIQSDNIAAGGVTASNITASSLGSITATLGDVSAGTITSSTITGTTITGGTFQTDEAGTYPRVFIDDTGLYFEVSAGNYNFQARTSDGQVVTTGIVNAQPGSALPAASITGEVTDAQIAAIGAAKITGQIDNAQLGNQVVYAANIYSGAVQANLIQSTNLASGSVTANTISAIMGGGNKLINSGFEGLNSTGTGPSMASWPTTGVGVLTSAVTPVKDGLYSAKLTASGSGSMGLTQTTPAASITPTSYYTLSFWARANSASRSTSATLAFFNSSGTQLATNSVTSTDVSGAWVRTIVTAQAPANSDHATVTCQLTGVVSGEIHYIDSIQLEEGQIPTGWSPVTSELLPGTISATMIQTAAVTADAIAANSITATKIAAGAVTATKLSIIDGGSNLLAYTNPSFEDVTLPAFSLTGATVAEVVDPTVAKYGSNYLKVTATAATVNVALPYTSGYAIGPTVTAQTTPFTFSIWTFGASRTTTLNIRCWNSSGTLLGDIPIGVNEIQSSIWTRMVGTITLSEIQAQFSSTAVIGWSFSAIGCTAGDIFGIDGVQLEEADVESAFTLVGPDQIGSTQILPGSITTNQIAAGTILAANINASAGITGNQIAANTIVAGNIDVAVGGGNLMAALNPSFEEPLTSDWVGITCTLARMQDVTAKYGSAYLRATLTQNSACNIDCTDKIGILPGQSFTISCWMKSSVGRSCNFALITYDSSGTQINTENLAIFTTSSNWQRFTATIKPTDITPTAASISLVIVVRTGSIGDTFDIDGVQIEEGDVATAFTLFGPGQVSGTQILPGSITTGRVAAGAITANLLTISVAGQNLLSNSSFAQWSSGTPTSWAVEPTSQSSGPLAPAKYQIEATFGGTASNTSLPWGFSGTTGSSNLLLASNLGFSIPSNATIAGIMVAVTGNGTQTYQGANDQTAELMSGGAIRGSNLAGRIPRVTVSGTNTPPSTWDYGASANLWGTTWTPAQINSTDFGFIFQAGVPAGDTSAAITITAITITVWYVSGLNQGTATSAQVAVVAGMSGNGWQLTCTSTGSINWIYGSSVNLIPSTIYQFSFWYKGSIAPQVPSPTGATVTWVTNPTPSASTWQRWIMQIQVSSTTTAWIPEITLAGAVTNDVGTLAQVQLEAGDVATNWSQYLDPTVIDGGTITAPVINGGVITGTTVQSSHSDPRTALDSTGFFTTTSAGAKNMTLNGTQGLGLQSVQGVLNIGSQTPGEISWYEGIAGSSNVAAFVQGAHYANAGITYNTLALGALESGTVLPNSLVFDYASNGTGYIIGNVANASFRLMDDGGRTSFMKFIGVNPNNLYGEGAFGNVGGAQISNGPYNQNQGAAGGFQMGYVSVGLAAGWNAVTVYFPGNYNGGFVLPFYSVYLVGTTIGAYDSHHYIYSVGTNNMTIAVYTNGAATTNVYWMTYGY